MLGFQFVKKPFFGASFVVYVCERYKGMVTSDKGRTLASPIRSVSAHALPAGVNKRLSPLFP